MDMYCAAVRAIVVRNIDVLMGITVRSGRRIE